MKSLKPVLWMLAGVFVGATAFGSPQPVRAQQSQPARFLKVIRAGTVENDFTFARFLYDEASAGCWLGISYGESWALAPAPNSACR
jgi:hypothetical protein